MNGGRSTTLLAIGLLSLGLTTVAATAQTKPNTASSAEKSPPVVAREIPNIKCTDPNTMTACKSFKQLVEARDKDILKALFGEKGHGETHYSYICPETNKDHFIAVYFDLPQPKTFERYWTSSLTSIDRGPNILTAFDEKLPADSAIANKWYDDHSDDKLYAFEFVSKETYDKGVLTEWLLDFGRWSMPDVSELQDNRGLSYEGAWAWLENQARRGDNSAASADDPEQPHIELDPASVFVYYSFVSQLDTLTGYTLQIQRSTGRFTETYRPAKMLPTESSGTCMVFKE
ncbi:MAG: hypothetical protein WA802_08800 [Terracidiphilus sp.]